MTRQHRRDFLRVLAAGSIGLAVGGASGPAAERRREREILIRGGRVVNSDGARDADVRIVGEVIAEIGVGLRGGEGARVIDATGRLVLPGGIDPHTHLHPPFADDMTTGSRAALAGGITTVGTFANPSSGEAVLDAIEGRARQASAETIVDLFLHAVPWPPTPKLSARWQRWPAAGNRV